MERERIEFKLPSNLLYIDPILAFVRQLAQQLGLPQTRINDAASAIDEICSNAIEHGSETVTSGVDLIIIFDADRLEILVHDKGKKTAGNWLETGRLDEVHRAMTPDSERGHGIYIAEKLSDHLEIKSNSLGGTDVLIVFDLSRPVASFNPPSRVNPL